jgi:hypothetical protein
LGASPASTGTIRGTSGFSLLVRNSKNNADVTALSVLSDEVVRVGDGTNNPEVDIAALNLVDLNIGGGTEFRFTTATLDCNQNTITDVANITIGAANTATTGDLRHAHGATLLAARRQDNGANLPILRVGIVTNNLITIGGGTEGVAGVDLEVTTGSVKVKVATGTEFEFTSATLNCNQNTITEVSQLTGAFFGNEVDAGNSGTADTIDWSVGPVYKSTLTGNCTYTFTAPAQHKWVQLRMIQDGTGGRTVTWPASVKWANGAQPLWVTTAAAVNIATFWYDGTNYYGVGSTGFA